MELQEAIDILKNQIGDVVIADYCKDCWHKKDCVDDCNYLLSIYTVLQALENSISKDKIKERIEELRPKLEETSKREEKAKEQEEKAVLWCIGIRLDERIKAYEELLKGE